MIKLTVEYSGPDCSSSFSMTEPEAETDEALSRAFAYLMRAMAPFVVRDYHILAEIVCEYAEERPRDDDPAPVDAFVDAAWKIREYWDKYDWEQGAKKG